MKRQILPLSVLVLAAAAAAQPPSVKLATETVVGVFATNGTTTDIQFWGGGTPITGTQTVTATSGGAQASTIASDPMAGGALGAGVRISEDGDAVRQRPAENPSAGTTTSTSPSTLNVGPHSFLMTVGAPVIGKIVVVYAGQATQGSAASTAVDIDADGRVEFRATANGSTQQMEFPVASGSDLSIRLTTSGHARPGNLAVGGSYRATLTVTYVPDRACQITPYGQGCGPTLAGSDMVVGTTHVFTLDVKGAFPSAPVSLVFGDRRVSLALPGFPGCPLLTNPLAIVTVRADANGEVNRNLRVPGPMVGTAYIQAIPFQIGTGQIRLRTSNGLQVDCGT